MPEPMLTVTQVAEELGASPAKVRRWIHAGRLQAINLSAPDARRHTFRVTREALDAFRADLAYRPPKPPRRSPRLRKGVTTLLDGRA